MDEFYLTASTLESSRPDQAEVTLPTPLNLLENDYEIGVAYSYLRHEWTFNDDCIISHFNRQTSKTTQVYLGKVPNLEPDLVLSWLSSLLAEEFGSNMKTAPVKVVKLVNEWYLRVPPNSEVHISNPLAKALSVSNKLVNVGTTVADYKVSFDYESLLSYIDERLFYFSCQQAAPNLVNSFGSMFNALHFVHVADRIVETSNRLSYSRLEGSLLNKLVVKVLDCTGMPINRRDFQFFVILHVRKINNAKKIGF
jgi:hypothetical protein